MPIVSPKKERSWERFFSHWCTGAKNTYRARKRTENLGRVWNNESLLNLPFGADPTADVPVSTWTLFRISSEILTGSRLALNPLLAQDVISLTYTKDRELHHENARTCE